jgi:hypothetical protein
MSLSIILTVGVILSIIMHFVGVYAGARNIVWIVIVLLWAAAINIATSEVKPKAYDDLKKIQGKYEDTDKLIKEALPEISVYEMIVIKKSFLVHEPKK